MNSYPDNDLLFLTRLCIDQKIPSAGTAGLDWKKIERLAVGNRVQPHITRVLDRLDAPEQFRASWTQRTRHSVYNNLALSSEIIRLSELCRSEEIPHYFYKGKPWSLWLFGDINMRESVDIDILVPPVYLSRLIDLLQADGYVMEAFRKTLYYAEEHIRRSFLKNDYHIELSQAPGGKAPGVNVEAHWNIAYPRLCFDFPHEEYPRYKKETDFLGKKIDVFIDEYQFLLLILHHGGKERWNRLKYMADLAAFLTRYGKTADWNLIGRLAREKGMWQLAKWSLGILKGIDPPAWAGFMPDDIEAVSPVPFLKKWDKLKPIPQNVGISQFFHSLLRRDSSHKMNIVKSHLKLLNEIPLHRKKMEWYRSREQES